jgi:hypothetical protein
MLTCYKSLLSVDTGSIPRDTFNCSAATAPIQDITAGHRTQHQRILRRKQLVIAESKMQLARS